MWYQISIVLTSESMACRFRGIVSTLHPKGNPVRHQSQTNWPFSFIEALIPPPVFLVFLYCSTILDFSSSRLCEASFARRSDSSCALAAFCASRFARFCRCFFVNVSGALCVD